MHAIAALVEVIYIRVIALVAMQIVELVKDLY